MGHLGRLSDFVWCVVTRIATESSNVYIPAQIADPSLIMQGDVVTVRAHWNQRNSNWRAFGDCVRDGKPILGREMNSAAFAGAGESPVSVKSTAGTAGTGQFAGGGGGGGGGSGGAGGGGGSGDGQVGQGAAGGTGTTKGWMNNYKTRICKNWQQGTCQYGNKCTFAHGIPTSQTKSNLNFSASRNRFPVARPSLPN